MRNRYKRSAFADLFVSTRLCAITQLNKAAVWKNLCGMACTAASTSSFTVRYGLAHAQEPQEGGRVGDVLA
jgi:hypothetical protein